MTQSLFQESQQDGDNDARFQCLTEQDEEDLTMQMIISIVLYSKDMKR